MSKLKSYHFDIGNSNTGPLGMCARIRATSKAEALSLFQEALGDWASVQPCDNERAVEYIHVYFNDDYVSE